MKRGVLVCTVLLATLAAAEEKEATPETEVRRMFVGVVPISLSQGLVAIDGEHAVGPRLSIRAGIRAGAGLAQNEGVQGGPEGSTSRFSVGLEPGIRYYVTGTALDGMWLGPHLELSYGQFNSSSLFQTLPNLDRVEVSSSGQSWRVGMAALVGYSMVVARGLTVQAGVGLGGGYSSERTTMEDTLNPEQPVAVVFKTRRWEVSERVTLAVGWSF